MNVFPLHTIESAPEGARSTLAAARQRFGFVPNVYAHMAEAPVVLEALSQLGTLFSRTSLSETHRHLLYLTSSVENQCHFCVAAHTRGARSARVPESTVAALRAGHDPEEPADAALVSFVRSVIRNRGFVPDDEVRAFLGAGFTPQQALEVILGVTLKILTNYTNHITHTEVNAELGEFAWEGRQS